jgi:hypothetical protein
MHVKRGKLVRCNNYFHCAAITCNKGVINDRIITSAVVHKLNYRLVLVQLATCRRRRSKVTPQNLSGKITFFFPFCTFPSFLFLYCHSSCSINVDVLTSSLPTHPRFAHSARFRPSDISFLLVVLSTLRRCSTKTSWKDFLSHFVVLLSPDTTSVHILCSHSAFRFFLSLFFRDSSVCVHLRQFEQCTRVTMRTNRR